MTYDPRDRIGASGALASRMIAPKKREETVRNTVIFGTISSIIDELIWVRTTERHLSRKLESGVPTNNQSLLNKIRDFHLRVELLDRALDDYSSQCPQS